MSQVLPGDLRSFLGQIAEHLKAIDTRLEKVEAAVVDMRVDVDGLAGKVVNMRVDVAGLAGKVGMLPTTGDVYRITIGVLFGVLMLVTIGILVARAFQWIP